MKELAEHMVLNPELKKSFDDSVRKSKAKAKQDVRQFSFFVRLQCMVAVVLVRMQYKVTTSNPPTCVVRQAWAEENCVPGTTPLYILGSPRLRPRRVLTVLFWI